MDTNQHAEDITSSPLFDNLRKLISMIDELRDIGLQKYISLPRIAVLGTQSSGKSSLLESIVGLDFLPRGDGVVTRRPLELRLIRVQGDADLQPWAIFDAVKGQKFTNFDEVRQQIEKLTDAVAGQNKGIVDDPIILTVYSTTCPDLTVIDLPGITRIPIGGQPHNIEQITKDMVTKYCRDPRTIILTVIPANADLSTSEALKMAQELDPAGIRTIGVITKIDIMDKGTDAKKMLLGQEISLRLGYVGVKNRSQQDIKDKMRVKKALEIENNFFASHPEYSRLPPGHVGTESLVAKLTKVMYEHIRKLLPDIIREINNKAAECEDKLRDLGPALPVSSREKTRLIWNMINTFTEQYKNKIRGKYEGKLSSAPIKKSKEKDDPNKDMSVAAKIKLMFNQLYKNFADDKDFKMSKSYSDNFIEETLRAHEGDSIPGFPSIDAFLALLQPKLVELKFPSMDLVNQIYQFLENIAIQLVGKTFQRFPVVLDDMTEIVCRVLAAERDRTKRIVEALVDAECGYLFTNDQDYLTHRTNFIPPGATKAPQQAAPAPVDSQKLFLQEMRNRLDSYFNIVVRNLRDGIPKAIGHFLVKNAQDNLQFALFDEINKSQSILESLGEPHHITQEREVTTRMLEVLQKASRHLKKDPDLAAPIKVPGPEEGKHGAGAKPGPAAAPKKTGWF